MLTPIGILIERIYLLLRASFCDCRIRIAPLSMLFWKNKLKVYAAAHWYVPTQLHHTISRRDAHILHFPVCSDFIRFYYCDCGSSEFSYFFFLIQANNLNSSLLLLFNVHANTMAEATLETTHEFMIATD